MFLVIIFLAIKKKLIFEDLSILDTNASGKLECAITMITDDSFTRCRQLKISKN
jgi:hypothetical protein